MKIVSSFKHLEHTEALDQQIEAKSLKLKKFFEGNFEVHWTCFIKEDGSHCAEIKLLGPQFEYHASAHAENLYKSFDLVIAKIEKQIHKKKTKWKGHISQKHKQHPKEQQIAQSEWDEKFREGKDIEDVAS
jgi:putative sigma-54 modulation protein